ncbi:uncharacterized protein LOC112468599 [Temnothorax curvispinosus]|uniref:Uncharacterized protein LOC112468599 n=1 Tax=Temnothorax curvispinosus TaxID=300111 RepID=A0A6J1RF92_9HYME|nr:uncharacterized protein LOC112468599 [Temnothorax curvispinosus]
MHALHTRAVLAGAASGAAGKREPSTIYSWHDRPCEWGFCYKKINDSTTSQFTVGPSYARHQLRNLEVLILSTFICESRWQRIANFFTSTRKDTEEDNMSVNFRSVLISDPVDESCGALLAEHGIPVTTKYRLPKDELINELQVGEFNAAKLHGIASNFLRFIKSKRTV